MFLLMLSIVELGEGYYDDDSGAVIDYNDIDAVMIIFSQMVVILVVLTNLWQKRFL